MMHELLKTSYGFLYPTLVTRLKNPSFVAFISHLHNASQSESQSNLAGYQFGEVQSSEPTQRIARLSSENNESSRTRAAETSIDISHPWPEWVELMERLFKSGYFGGDGNPFENLQLGPKEANAIRSACLNFARDRYSLIRFWNCFELHNFGWKKAISSWLESQEQMYMSRKDIQVIAGSGCPSIDRKVVNSGKRLRVHVGIDEGSVCSHCNLRGNCERAYVKAREDQGGRTVDVMRFLLTYGLEPMTGSVENKPCLNKTVKESVRRLLKEMVDHGNEGPDSGFSSVAHSRADAAGKNNLSTQKNQGDWLCPKCNFLNFAKNIRCLRCDDLFEDRLQQLRENQEHLPLKKGDWICHKCNFLNFAKNTKCLQCKEKAEKRQINPGEWECESCNYINFRRNMVCLKCDHRRPKASNASKTSAQLKQPVGEERKERDKSSNMWRFVSEEEVEEEKHQESSISGDEDSMIFDFPIMGGKSKLSQAAQMHENSKLENCDRIRSPTRAREKEKSAGRISQRRLELLETDDEEMAEWFRPK